jgi:hypothetical protein
MPTTLTIHACLARAHDLTDLADREPDYDLILLYDDLAREWRRMARRIETSGRNSRQAYGARDRRLQDGSGPVSFRHD